MNLPSEEAVIRFETALTRTATERAYATQILRDLISGIIVFPRNGRGEVKIKIVSAI
jgi:hypothetical protein